MRTMHDSTSAADIPDGGELVAGYIDGRFEWSADDWNRFPGRTRVRIACFASTDDGHVLDVEWGDASPSDVPAWLAMRRAAGVDPTVYVNRANWQAVRDACVAAGVAEPHYWLAAYDGVREVPAGTIAKQYANAAITGGHFDTSAVAEFWPGVDASRAVPLYEGESVAVVTLHVGEVAIVEGIFRWPDGRERAIVQKVVAYEPGMRVLTMYPPADPDADPTLVLDAQPALFIVTTIE